MSGRHKKSPTKSTQRVRAFQKDQAREWEVLK